MSQSPYNRVSTRIREIKNDIKQMNKIINQYAEEDKNRDAVIHYLQRIPFGIQGKEINANIYRHYIELEASIKRLQTSLKGLKEKLKKLQEEKAMLKANKQELLKIGEQLSSSSSSSLPENTPSLLAKHLYNPRSRISLLLEANKSKK